MPKEGKSVNTKYIQPDARLINYIKERTELVKSRDKIDRRKRELESKQDSKNTLSAREEKELRDIPSKLNKLKSESGILSDKKTEILDKIIFPSMANLTLFFEVVSTIPELSNFVSDIKELLGVRRDNPRAYNYAFMFRELILGMIGVGNEEDYKLKLLHELQSIILRKCYGLGVAEGTDISKAATIIFQDIGRAVAWTEMLASRARDEYDLSLLNPRYDIEELKKCKNDDEQKNMLKW